jgi:hypothetical protein
MLFGETVAVYCENHMEHTDILCGQTGEFLDVEAGVLLFLCGSSFSKLLVKFMFFRIPNKVSVEIGKAGKVIIFFLRHIP